MGRRRREIKELSIDKVDWGFHNLCLDFAENEEHSPLVDAVNSLPKHERHLLLLYIYYGSYAPIARHYNVSVSWTRLQIKTLINKLNLEELKNKYYG